MALDFDNTPPLASALPGAWAAVRAASTANVDINSAVTSMDGVDLEVGDDVLLKNQSASTENGIYTVGESALARRADAANPEHFSLVKGVPVLEGTENGGKNFHLSYLTAIPVTVGSSALIFVEGDFGGIKGFPAHSNQAPTASNLV